MPPLATLSGRRVLFVMATEAEYGPHLQRMFTPLMTGVGPVEAGVRLAAALAELKCGGKLPDLVVSLGSAGSRRLKRTEIFQVSSVIYRDMDALRAQGYRILGETGVGYMLRPEVRT